MRADYDLVLKWLPRSAVEPETIVEAQIAGHEGSNWLIAG
jgi:hypothetical protein